MNALFLSLHSAVPNFFFFVFFAALALWYLPELIFSHYFAKTIIIIAGPLRTKFNSQMMKSIFEWFLSTCYMKKKNCTSCSLLANTLKKQIFVLR